MEPGRKMVYDHCGKLVGTAALANHPLNEYSTTPRSEQSRLSWKGAYESLG